MTSLRGSAAPSFLEFFGVDQRVEEIDAQQDADRQADDGFDHSPLLLKTAAGVGVDAHQTDQQNADRDVDKIEHGAEASD
jgi:hypothetical protein